MPSHLLRRPEEPDTDGRFQHITPANANWRYVGFSAYRLSDGQKLSFRKDDQELCLVVISGSIDVTVDGKAMGHIGGRANPFEALPWSVYMPPRQILSIKAMGDVEIGLCLAPAKGLHPARVIAPDAVGQETRGSGTNTRHVRNILPETAVAESLLVVEVITPGGNWSSYPSHKHDQDDLPHESFLEETYYHRLARPGFAFQRVYTDDGSLDETMTVHDRDVVLVPKGYHPVGAPHGFDLYYLNVMAGPHRTWKFRYDERVTFLLPK
jgi:5-deoxy-glucuronate isomerase